MNIKESAEKYKDYIIEKRRWFHQYPELSYEEYETTNVVASELEEMGISVTRFEGMPGCVGILKGAKPGRTILLRADMDALTVKEETGLPYASKYDGKMHACGHDAHMAMLLGSARILSDMKSDISGSVKFFFQPAEELSTGAKRAVEQGVTKDVDACFGMHIWHSIDSCHFNIEAGERMAAIDYFTIRVHGNSAHGATPHLGNDAILAACATMMNLQSVVSRSNNAFDPLVITAGTIQGGKRFNILADYVELKGSIRTFNKELGNKVEKWMRNIVETSAASYGCKGELIYDYMLKPVINEDLELVNICRNAAIKLYGEEVLVPFQKLTGAEDFSFLMDQVPSIFGFLGARSENVPGSELSNHHERFTVDEETLRYGAAISAQFAFDFLNISPIS